MTGKSSIVIAARCTQSLYQFRLNLMKSLQAEGWRVYAVGVPDPKYVQLLESEGIEIHSLKRSRSRYDMITELQNFFSLCFFLQRIKPQVIHSFSIRPVIFATLAAKIVRVPRIICTISGLGHAFISAHRIFSFLVRTLYRFALQFSDFVFFQNPDDLNLFVQRRIVHARKARLIAGSGVDLDKFQTANRGEASPSSATPFQVLMVARLLKEKGVIEFLEAAKLLIQKNSNFQFKILGGPDPLNPSSISWSVIEGLNLSPSIQMIGYADDVRPYLKNADVVVLPSYREGVPRSLLEAAASGRPLIATDVPGCREVVVDGQNGFLVPAKDYRALAQALDRCRLMSQAERNLMGAKSRELVEKRFDEKIVIAETKLAYVESSIES